MINKQSYQIQGMRQDNLVATGHSTKFAHEIMNMRLNTIGDYTTAAWTTEKGTKHVDVLNMPMYNGTIEYSWLTDEELDTFQPLGQAVINDEWVLFGKITGYDVILCLHYKDDILYGRILFKGQLGFDLQHPIETLVFYENELIQKVYWTDGVNQPRMINIRGVDNEIGGYNSAYPTQFDFVQEVSLNENVEVKKLNSGTGMFPPCTVKYAITYYHKYGQETNIVYDSPLYYPTIGDRACGPEELSGDSFEITVTNLDRNHGFDYIRLYSIVRTSDNATPIVRIVEDKPLNNDLSSITFIDTNTTGKIVDSSILNYVGGNQILAETFDQKDNTLFLGNISIKNKSVTELLKDERLFWPDNTGFVRQMLGGDYYKIIPIHHADETSIARNTKWYNYTNQLNNIDSIKYVLHESDEHSYTKYRGNSSDIKNFKKGEFYRFGVQFQDITGKWSEVVRLNDEVECDLAPISIQNDNYYVMPVYWCQLNSTAVSKLTANGYKKARLVCCYTTNADRTFITQGVINQTVYNRKLAKDDPGSPYAMSSWFFRPFNNGDIGSDAPTNNYEIEQKEVQSIIDNINSSWFIPESVATAASETDCDYLTRKDYWTLNSPDIEFDESLRTLNWEYLNINNVGYFDIDGRSSSVYIDATSFFTNHLNEKGTGLNKLSTTEIKRQQGPRTIRPQSHDFDSFKWNDVDPYYPHCPDENGQGGSGLRNFPIYPFQRQTSLSNYIKDVNDYDVTYRDNTTHDIKDDTINVRQGSKINYKIFANLIYSQFTTLGDVDYNFTQINDIEIFDSDEVVPILLNNKIYNGNSNFISPMGGSITYSLWNPCKDNGAYVWSDILGSYELERYEGSTRTNLYGSDATTDHNWPTYPSNYRNYAYCSDPVKITYKSTPHIVFSGTINGPEPNTRDTNVNNFYLAEVTRQGVQNRFGGTNNKSNIYLPCGPAVTLSGATNLYGYEGDHYLMRYDCLKTYPYSTDDVNQIVEIMSFMCETRINLDGRYDKNRGLVDNTIVLPTNFNLINKSYTQSNNFFSFTELRDDKVATELDKFPAQITWTKEKVSGEDVDTWTNITLASTADANGTLGAITKILSLNDRLYSFQEHGLSVIGFNERTAISVENGTPLELAKTGKFTGFNYITNQIGCQNKWSISSTKNGLLWIDDSRQELLRLGESIQSLSTTYGFDAFMIKELPSMFKSWNPTDFDNFVTYYDKLSNDVYYINKNKCLAWNEQTGTFTSFYSYENTPYMASLGSHSVMWHDGVWVARELDTYSTFFNTVKDYWMTLVCDGMVNKGNAFAADKVFNNIEFCADVFNLDGLFNNFEHAGPYNTPIFNLKHVWNGYQDSQECPMDGIRKFNTWRVQLPRHHGTRDRIRNPFCYIKLKQDQSVNIQTDRIILHDLAVYFDMK